MVRVFEPEPRLVPPVSQFRLVPPTSQFRPGSSTQCPYPIPALPFPVVLEIWFIKIHLDEPALQLRRDQRQQPRLNFADLPFSVSPTAAASRWVPDASSAKKYSRTFKVFEVTSMPIIGSPSKMQEKNFFESQVHSIPCRWSI